MSTTHRVQDLEGVLLDAAVAKSLGASARIAEGPTGDAMCFAQGAPMGPKHGPTWKSELPFCPSDDWCDGGPIVDVEHIAFRYDKANQLAEACVSPDSDYDTFVPARASYATGRTTLEAAMRAWVIHKFGEEIELP